MMALGSERLHHVQQVPARSYLKHVPIAPATRLPFDGPRHNKPYVYANKPYNGSETNPSVVRRNARERNRVKQVNNGFVSLRQHIPQAIVADLSNSKRSGGSKKLSKVDTLRMAVEYIRRLQSLLDDDSNDGASSMSFSSPSSTEEAQQQTSNMTPHTFSLYDQQYNFENYYPTQSYQNPALISPTSSAHSDGYYSATEETPKVHTKFENSFVGYNNATEGEEILDYISLWQEEL